MKNRGYFALIVVFFASLIGLWWADYAGLRDRATRLQSGSRILADLWETKPDDVHRLEIEGGPRRLVFERRPGNRWQVVEPVDVAADPSLVETLAANLKMLEKVRDAGTVSDDPSQYGLNPPVRTVRLYGSGGSKPLASLEVGNLAANKDRRYVRASGSGGIEVVEAKALSAVEIPLARWRDRLLVRMPTFQVQTLAAKRGDGPSLRVERVGDLWEMVEPFKAVADDGRVDGVLAEVGALRVSDDGFVADDARDLAPYGLDKPTLSVTLTPRAAGAPPQTVHIGKVVPKAEADKDRPTRHYARRDDQDDVVAVDAGLLKDLGAHPADLHGKKVADLTPARVDAIRLTSGGSAVTVARRAKGWERIAPLNDKADNGAVAELIKKVDEAEASLLLDARSAVDPQLDKPWAVIEVWQDSGPKPGEGPGSVPTSEPRLRLALGRRDSVAKAVYAQVVGDPVILALPSTFLDGLTTGGLAFRDRQVASVVPPQVERLSVTRAGKTVVIVPPQDGNPAAWRLKEPVDAPTDPETVGRLLFQLSNLRAVSLLTDKPEPDAKYGFDKPALTVSWKVRDEHAPPPRRTIVGEEATLTVGGVVPGKPDPPRYARVSSSPIVFALAPEVVAAFEAELRDRLAVSFNLKAVERITLRWPTLALGARPVPDVKTGEPDWTPVDAPAGLKFDAAKLKPMVKSLSHLTTSHYAQYGGPIPPEMGLFPARLTIEVKSAGGGRPHVLRLGRHSADGYVLATTEDGPSGAVFTLSMSNWEPWLKTPTIETRPAKDETPPAKDAKPK